MHFGQRVLHRKPGGDRRLLSVDEAQKIASPGCILACRCGQGFLGQRHQTFSEQRQGVTVLQKPFIGDLDFFSDSGFLIRKLPVDPAHCCLRLVLSGVSFALIQRQVQPETDGEPRFVTFPQAVVSGGQIEVGIAFVAGQIGTNFEGLPFRREFPEFGPALLGCGAKRGDIRWIKGFRQFSGAGKGASGVRFSSVLARAAMRRSRFPTEFFDARCGAAPFPRAARLAAQRCLQHNGFRR